MLALGYTILFKEDFAIDSSQALYYYKSLMNTLITGGISLQLISTIRYWYWNGYYDDLLIKDLRAKAAASDKNSPDSESSGSSTSPTTGGSSTTGGPTKPGGVNFSSEL